MNRIRTTALAAAVALALAGPALAAGDAHSHGQAGQLELTLNQGQKWPTDEPLRRGMENIRTALAGGMKYAALATKVNGDVAYIVQNCKLEPAADAQLHLVIAEILAGVEALEGKAKGETRRAGAERIARALEAYGEHFDHPGWGHLHD